MLDPVSFDAFLLYTNMNTKEAIETALENTIKDYVELHGLGIYNIFKFPRQQPLRLQGQKPQTKTWICNGQSPQWRRFISMEGYIDQQLHPQLTIYVRYVDDVSTVTADTDQAKKILTYMNEQHPAIKFGVEVRDNDCACYLPIIDMTEKTAAYITN